MIKEGLVPSVYGDKEILITKGTLIKNSVEFTLNDHTILSLDRNLDVGKPELKNWYFIWLYKQPNKGTKVIFSLSNKDPLIPEGSLKAMLPIAIRYGVYHTPQRVSFPPPDYVQSFEERILPFEVKDWNTDQPMIMYA